MIRQKNAKSKKQSILIMKTEIVKICLFTDNSNKLKKSL